MAREPQTTVKQRAARIPLDYFQRKSKLERWKGGLAMLAAVVGLGYVGWGAVAGSSVARHYSPGPLAAAHAMWDNRCDACHQNFVPVSADAWTGDLHAADQLCQACHRGAEHSPNQMAAEVASCAACHRDHHGRNANLNHVADFMCTICHSNIANHLRPGAKPFEPPLADVTSFVDDHPEFRSARRDPGQLKFSHSRHMRPGLTFGLGELRLNDLSPADRDRYRLPGQSESDVVTLNCSTCHQLDRSAERSVSGAAGVSPTLAPVRPAGDYMLPISYDLHCRACHPLTYMGRVKPVQPSTEAATQSVPSGARYLAVKPGETVPHGWTGEQLRRYVEQVLDMKFMNNPDRDLLAQPLADALRQPLDKWRLPHKPPRPDEPAQTVGEYLNDELKVALNHLRLQCIECHHMSAQPESLDVQSVSIHPAWFAHARFSHAAHRAVTCQSCHGGAYPQALPAEPTALKTIDSDEVMIPGRKLCVQCHSPAQGSGASATGGARFDCAQCHRYHHGQSPWHGRGAAALDAEREMPLQEFITGEKSVP